MSRPCDNLTSNFAPGVFPAVAPQAILNENPIMFRWVRQTSTFRDDRKKRLLLTLCPWNQSCGEETNSDRLKADEG